jgi:hypothetical protein
MPIESRRLDSGRRCSKAIASASEGVALLEDHDAVNAARPRSQYVFEVVCHLNFPVADVQ